MESESRRMRRVGQVARLTLMKNLCRILVKNLTPFGLPSPRQEDNIKMNLDEITDDYH